MLICWCFVLALLSFILLYAGNTWACFGHSSVWGEWIGWLSARSGPPYKCYCCCSWSWTCPWKHFLFTLQGIAFTSAVLLNYFLGVVFILYHLSLVWHCMPNKTIYLHWLNEFYFFVNFLYFVVHRGVFFLHKVDHIHLMISLYSLSLQR